MVTHKQLGYMKQHIDAATVQVLLMRYELHNDDRDDDDGDDAASYLKSMTQLPAAAHLSSEFVSRLLLAAASSEGHWEHTGFHGVHVLCHWQAASSTAVGKSCHGAAAAGSCTARPRALVALSTASSRAAQQCRGVPAVAGSCAAGQGRCA
jgi:hypothetical protein